MSGNKIRIFILSKQSFFRQGLEDSLSRVEEFEITVAMDLSQEVLTNMDVMPPEVAIVDIDSPDGGGLETTRQLKQRYPSVGIISLTSNYNDVLLFEALKGQASACLNKEITAEQLVEIIKRVANGEHPINETLITHPILADQVLMQFQELSRQSETQSLVSPLTQREMEILNYVAQGLLNKQIAALLGISEQTIKNHVTSILRKLNANARTEAVILALKKGLISIQIKS